MTFRTQEEIMQCWPSKWDNPMVSIRCITFNHESFIEQALDSFLMQRTTFPFEIVVHDDASSDKTANIIREYEKNYPNIIKPIYETENLYSKNVAQFRKIVDDACRGKYIAYCEGDDCWIDPNKLQMQVDWLETHPEYTMCCTDAVIESPDSILDWHRYEEDCDVPVKDMILGGGAFVQSATLLYCKKLLTNYPDKCQKCHVGDFPLQLWAALNGKVRYIRSKTAMYRFSHVGSWNDKQKQEPIDKLINGWQSEFDMIECLDIYSERRYAEVFKKYKEEFLYRALKKHKEYWRYILSKNEGFDKKFIHEKKIEGFFIRMKWTSVANSYFLITQKQYKDALYSLPVLKIVVPFIYYKVFKCKPSG